MKRIVLILLLTLTASPAPADVLATGTGFADIEGGEPFTHRLVCREDRARWDFSGKQYLEATVYYRGDLGVYWVVDPVRKGYFEMPVLEPGETDMRMGLLAMVYAVSRKALSDEKRAELDRGVARMPIPEYFLDFRRKGTVKTGKWKCGRYEVFFGAEKKGEYLTARAKDLGLDGEDYGFLMNTWRQCVTLYSRFEFLFPDPPEGKRGSYEGFPVAWAFEKGGRSTFSVRFKSIARHSANDATYDLPPGVKKMEVFDLLMK